MGQLPPSVVLVITHVTVPPAVALKRVGRPPHRPVLELTARRVRADRPAAQEAGMVLVSWLAARFSRTRLDRALQDAGRGPTRLLDCSCSSVSEDSVLHDAGSVPVMLEVARFREARLSI